MCDSRFTAGVGGGAGTGAAGTLHADVLPLLADVMLALNGCFHDFTADCVAALWDQPAGYPAPGVHRDAAAAATLKARLLAETTFRANMLAILQDLRAMAQL